ncbi:ABC transporter permease [Aureimonas sp. AU40]|uniref:ABC transporter permease n=1 Tax=Aureimonas sp. AU40 TaxID=1637747 RepID=UPI0007853822|nr:ABC transporter permease [Aureimonas sp. AU40]
MDLPFLWHTFVVLLGGLPLTLELAAISILAGYLLALAIAFLGSFAGPLGSGFANVYVFVFRGSPLLVQIFLIYYGLGQFRPTLQQIGLWPFLRDPFWCAALALTLNTAAYGSEIFRGGLRAVPAREVEAARACGMSGFLLLRRIVVPIALRQALPAYGNEIILMVKATALASIITLMEVTGLAQKLISETFRAVEVFVVAGAIYLALNFILTRIVLAVEHRLSPHLRDRSVGEIDVRSAHA